MISLIKLQEIMQIKKKAPFVTIKDIYNQKQILNEKQNKTKKNKETELNI